MAIPTFVGTSAASASGTGQVTPAMPPDATTGDFLVLLIEGEGEDGNADGPPTGGEWTAIGPGTVASATDGSSDRTRLSAYWAPYDAGINRVVPDAGNHTLARIHAFRGVDLSDPFNQTSSGSSSSNLTSHSAATGFSTDVDDCLVCVAASHGDDIQASLASPANANLSDVSIITSSQTNQGSDGCFLIIAGGLASQGAAGTFSWSSGAASVERAWIAFALQPASSDFETAAAVDGAGQATATAETETETAAAAAGVGAVTLAGTTEADATASLEGGGGVLAAAETEAETAAVFSGAGSATVGAETEAEISVTVTGSGSVDVSASTTAPDAEIAPTVTGGGTVAVVAETEAETAGSLSGSGQVTAAPTAEAVLAPVAAGSGGVTVGAETVAETSVSVSGVGQVDVAATTEGVPSDPDLVDGSARVMVVSGRLGKEYVRGETQVLTVRGAL